MPLILNGSTGVSGTDGSAGTPAVQGTDTNTGMFFPAADQIAFAEGGVEAMRLDASGNVGIGVTAPVPYGTNGRVVQIDGGANTSELRLTNNTTGTSAVNGGLFQMAGNELYIWNVENSFISFGTNNTDRARITATGDFQFNSGYGSTATAFGCRAWVNFNGTGTVAIRGSGGVSSITDRGMGYFRVNFSNTMPDINYSSVITPSFAASYAIAQANTDSSASLVTPTTSWTEFAVLTYNASQFTDPTYCHVAIFR